MRSVVRLRVNGADRDVTADPATPLLTILRNDLALNGPKFGCGLGECGACMVLVDGRAGRSCQLPVGAMAGREIRTLEGIGTRDRPHPVQAAFIAENASQCGYCLNGFIMTLVALLDRRPDASEGEIREAFRHNLCRCGAHIEILAAAHRAAGRAGPREGTPS